MRGLRHLAWGFSALVLAGCGSSSSDGTAPTGAGASGGASGAAGSGGSSIATGGASGASGSGGSSAGSGGASAGTGGANAGSSGASQVLVNDGLPTDCSPIRTPGACLSPFPNAIYTKEDTTTKTGVRLDLRPDTLPTEAVHNQQLSPDRYNMNDGFSPATPIVALFPERIDATSLPPITDPSQSLSATSATVIVDMSTNQFVAHFSEVDVTVKSTGRQALMMRPTTRLLPNHRYAVAINPTIKTQAGGLPTPPPEYAEIAAGNAPSDEMAMRQAARMPDILSSLSAAGVDTSKVLMAWDFVTASDESITSHVLSMRDTALSMVGDKGLGYSLSVSPNPSTDHLLRLVEGTFKVPQFLTSVDQTVAPTSLVFDEQGLPKLVAPSYDVKFAAIIPNAAKTKKVPLMVFGHGLLGSGPTYLETISELWQIADQYGYVLVATDWTGLSQWENPLTMGGNGAAANALEDFNDLPYITDRLQQALINAMVLVRTANGVMAQDPEFTVEETAGGTPVLDGGQPVYFGISLGGIMGGSFMGYTPDISRGVLNVAGSTWSLMFQRSSNWQIFKLIINASYPDGFDQQVLLALSQSQFDYSDPISVATHLTSDPLPNTPAKQILQQMSVNDAQVPNIASEILARTAGLPLLNDSPIPIYSMSPVAAPQMNALTVWDTKPMQIPPLTNQWIPDNGAHVACSAQPFAQKQIDVFLRTGQINSYCDGTCDPE